MSLSMRTPLVHTADLAGRSDSKKAIYREEAVSQLKSSSIIFASTIVLAPFTCGVSLFGTFFSAYAALDAVGMYVNNR